HPSSVGTLVRDEELPGRRIAPDKEMLPRHLVVGVESKVHRDIVPPTADTYLVLTNQVKLWAGVVFIPDLRVDPIGRPGAGGPGSSGPRCRNGRLAVQQRGLRPTVSGLRGLVQFRMNLDVAQRNGPFRIR